MWTDRDRQLRQLRSCFQPPQPPSPLSFSLPPTISLYFYFPLTQKHTITATHTHMKATLSRAFGELHIATVRSPVLREAWQIKHESRFNKRHNKASFAARGHTRIRWYRNRKQLPVEKKNMQHGIDAKIVVNYCAAVTFTPPQDSLGVFSARSLSSAETRRRSGSRDEWHKTLGWLYEHHLLWRCISLAWNSCALMVLACGGWRYARLDVRALIPIPNLPLTD